MGAFSRSLASSLSTAGSSRGQSRAAAVLCSPCGEADRCGRQRTRTPRLQPARGQTLHRQRASHPCRAAESSRIHSLRPSRCRSEPLSVESPFISSAPASYAAWAAASCSRGSTWQREERGDTARMLPHTRGKACRGVCTAWGPARRMFVHRCTLRRAHFASQAAQHDASSCAAAWLHAFRASVLFSFFFF